MKKIILIILFLSITPLTQAKEKEETLHHYTNLVFVHELPKQFKRFCYYRRNEETLLRVIKNIKDRCSYRLVYKIEDPYEVKVLTEHMDKNAINYDVVE